MTGGNPTVSLRVRPDLVEVGVTLHVQGAGSHLAAVLLFERAVRRLAELVPPGATVTPLDFAASSPTDTPASAAERALDLVLLDMQGRLVAAKKQVAVAIADEKRLLKQVETERGLTAEGSEHARRAAAFEKEWTEQRAAVEELKAALLELSSRIEAAKREKGLLSARMKRAEAKARIDEVAHSGDPGALDDALGAMRRVVDAAELEAEVFATRRLRLVTTPAVDAVRPATEPAVDAERPAPAPSPAAAPAPPAQGDARSTVRALLRMPLDAGASFWERARGFAALEDAMRGFAAEATKQNPMVAVAFDAPVFRATDTRGSLEQRSVGLDEVELIMRAAAT